MLQPSWWYFSSGSLCSRHFFSRSKSGAGVTALASPNVARVRILASTPYVGWVCCWFSPLLLEVFLRVLRFYLLLNNQHFQIPIRSRTHGHVSTSSYELQSTPWVNTLQLQNYNVRVAPSLCFKARLSAMPLIWFFFLMQIKLIFTRKVLHLVFGIGNGLMIAMFWLACVEYAKRGMGVGGVEKRNSLPFLFLPNPFGLLSRRLNFERLLLISPWRLCWLVVQPRCQ